MKLSTRTRYGTRALFYLALHWGGKPLPLKEIATSQGISLHYLEHLITPLVRAGIIKSTRGVGGGVKLARHPQEVTLGEVVLLLEGSITPVACVDNPESCSQFDFCATRDVWLKMKQATDEILDSTTLQDLVERQKEKAQSVTASRLGYSGDIRYNV